MTATVLAVSGAVSGAVMRGILISDFIPGFIEYQEKKSDANDP